ncbi:hypothetical protein Harman_29840 [Haloarcula mannanilytica]|uniref:Uncharacterized protein n=1 Tax=Haloarcula mannanilytica TaxID=2509225 RepID=A0A4C2ES92_9EURY|nr:hypothetical protein [Haloarcula mannanilytica]GCF15049.1 hypothetical protein Harman_29840 [Haloarcula mannanilytica]
MKCAFGNCKQEHDLWIKPDADSEVVPICSGCAENESEKYHLSFQDSKRPEEVEDYIVAYDPDTALAEQLIDIASEIEDSLSMYEGDKQEQIENIIEARKKIEKAINKL